MTLGKDFRRVSEVLKLGGMVFVGAKVVRRLTAELAVVMEVAWNWLKLSFEIIGLGLLGLDKGFRRTSAGLEVIGGGIAFPGISKVFVGEEGGSFGRFRRNSMVHGCLILQLDRQCGELKVI